MPSFVSSTGRDMLCDTTLLQIRNVPKRSHASRRTEETYHSLVVRVPGLATRGSTGFDFCQAALYRHVARCCQQLSRGQIKRALSQSKGPYRAMILVKELQS